MIDTNNLILALGITAMVSSDRGLPDPENPNGDLRVTNEDIIVVTDEDDESDDQEIIVLDEYQPLPLEEESIDPNHGYGSSEDEAHGHQSSNNSVPQSTSSIPTITPIEEELVKEVWSTPPPKAVDIEMDSKKVDEVKQVMMNITLPPSSIPEWATNIPEDEWKSQLMKRLQNIQEDKK